MGPKRPDTMTDIVITKCARNRQLNALFPFLVLFGAHILSFYEWKIVQQLLYLRTLWRYTNAVIIIIVIIIIPMWLVCLLANQHATFTWKDTISVFSVSQGSVEALIRWGEKI